jgi:DNA repair exonuclease SbcCD nuclease subunit
MMGYTEDKSDLECFFEEAGSGIAVIHQGVLGVELNAKGFTLQGEIFHPGMVPDRLKHVFCGHYHSHKRVTDKVTIPGSPMQLTWADKGEKRGWLDVTVTDGRVDIEHIESRAPKFIEIPAQHVTNNSIILKSMKDHFVRVVDAEPDQVDNIRAQMIDTASVEIRVKETTKEKVSTVKDFATTAELFEEFVKVRELDPARVKVGKKLMDDTYEVTESTS